MGNDTSSMKKHWRHNLSSRRDFTMGADSSFTPITAVLTVAPILAIIVIIVFGNALVIFAVLRDDRLKNKVQNWLILSLSVADLLVGLLIMPLTLTYEILGRWTLGAALCEIWLALDVLFVTASILNLCVISIDRYWSLSDPVYSASKRTRVRTLTMIACIWVLAFAICLPPLAGWRPDVRSEGKCNLSEDVGYVLYSSIGSFYSPLMILIFIYVKIFQITRRRAQVQRRKVQQRENLLLLAAPASMTQEPNVSTPLCADKELVEAKSNNATRKAIGRCLAAAGSPSATVALTPPIASKKSSAATAITVLGDNPSRSASVIVSPKSEKKTSDNCDVLPGLLLKPFELQLRMMEHRKQARRRERQATILLGLILGAFTVSWLPFFFIYTLGALCCKTSELLFDVTFWMGYCNSGLNPFIYNFFNPDFRLAFRKILCRKPRRGS